MAKIRIVEDKHYLLLSNDWEPIPSPEADSKCSYPFHWTEAQLRDVALVLESFAKPLDCPCCKDAGFVKDGICVNCGWGDIDHPARIASLEADVTALRAALLDMRDWVASQFSVTVTDYDELLGESVTNGQQEDES